MTEDYKALIKGMMGKKRYVHSCCVADMCVRLAEIFGEDKEKAYTAGILHDIRKEAEAPVQEKEMLSAGCFVDKAELEARSTWHGIAGAYYVKNVLGIEDNDIFNAIRFHTVGRAHMSKLEKIVYLADLVSEDRDFPDVEKYRSYALKSLENGMYQALKWLIPDLVSSGKKIPVSTTEAYNYYMDKAKGNEK